MTIHDKRIYECPMCKFKFPIKENEIKIWYEAQKELSLRIKPFIDNTTNFSEENLEEISSIIEEYI